MEVALISDVHGNLEALEAVLEDIESCGVETIYCLGDTIGYGPNPIECTKLIMEKAYFFLQGNHDYDILMDQFEGFNPHAQAAAYYVRERMYKQTDEKLVISLLEAPTKHLLGKFGFAHGFYGAIDEICRNAYIHDFLNEQFSYMEQLDLDKVFVGHTHVPNVYGKDEQGLYVQAGESGTLPHKAVVNIGSVGQPRDGDWRASWTHLNVSSNYYCFRRVGYDLETTQKKIREAGLPEFLAIRLEKGI